MVNNYDPLKGADLLGGIRVHAFAAANKFLGLLIDRSCAQTGRTLIASRYTTIDTLVKGRPESDRSYRLYLPSRPSPITGLADLTIRATTLQAAI
jgi:hypothetical protein